MKDMEVVNTPGWYWVTWEINNHSDLALLHNDLGEESYFTVEGSEEGLGVEMVSRMVGPLEIPTLMEWAEAGRELARACDIEQFIAAQQHLLRVYDAELEDPR